jgi:phosphoglycerol geranylgeranyltransferase
MANSLVYNNLVKRKQEGVKSFAVLIDPDKVTTNALQDICELAVQAKVDFLFVGGSLVITDHLDDCIKKIKANCNIPVVLFPGSPSQISTYADALLYLSLISGRNAELLIGQHVISAPMVKKSGLEIISTGYMVVDGGAPTTVSYISNASPLPSNKPDIALCTALAGEMLGMKVIYMDAGSGAQKPIPAEMIKRVAQQIDIPLIIGGGITTTEKAIENCHAGADVIVIGNVLEKKLDLMLSLSNAIHSCSKTLVGSN